MIEVRSLTKRFGSTLAVDDLSFDVQPGTVTGFLGPNGAGKSTTMRVIMGLNRPTAGSARIKGVPYAHLKFPLHEVGALLDAKGVHQSRSARSHLTWMAQSNGIARTRVEEVLDLVGLTSVAGRAAGSFSLGMGQRLGIAVALLGDPGVLLLDEPVNGLDPEGILWIRNLLKFLAGEGRSIFVSSHLMSEMALTAERVVVIGRGKLIADTTVAALVSGNSHAEVLVRSPQGEALCGVLVGAGGQVEAEGPAGEDGWRVRNLTSSRIGDLAAEHGLALHELTPQKASLEEVFMEMTSGAVEYGIGEGRFPEQRDPLRVPTDVRVNEVPTP